MKKFFSYTIPVIVLLGSAGNTLGQGGGFFISAGVASYQMDDLKYLQEHILNTYPVEGKITSAFPPYTSVSITGFKHIYDYFRIGGGYSFSTTGGKSSYADYSGNLYNTMTVTSHRLGAYLSYRLLGDDQLSLNLNGRLDANYSSLTIESYYKIYSYSSGLTRQYWSLSPTGSVGLEGLFRIRNFALGLEAGYLVDLKGKLKENGDGDPLLDPNDQEQVLRSDWTGWSGQLKFLIWIRQ